MIRGYHLCDDRLLGEPQTADRTVNRVCPEHGEPLVIGRNDLFCDVGWFRHNELVACDYSEPLPEDIRLREQGAPMLPLGAAS